MHSAFEDRKKQRIEWIPVKQICTVWVHAQRPFRERHAKDIAENFDPDKFGVLSVTLPNGDGIYHNIDGQHRRAAIESMWGGEQRVPCEIFEAKDPKRAAELFDALNSSRQNPKPFERFNVRVAAEYPEEVAVTKIVKELGFTVSSSKSPKAISCVEALLAVYRMFGSDTLKNSLMVIQATFGWDSHAVDAAIVRGYAAFMAEFRHCDWARLKTVVAKKYTPGRLVGAAKTAREMTGGSIAAAIKAVLIGTYNRGLPANKYLKTKGS